MKGLFNFWHAAKTRNNPISLQKLMKQLLHSFQPAAEGNKSFLLNDVPGDFYVKADENKLATTIRSLLNKVISRSTGSCIRLSAKKYNNVILLYVKETTINGRILSSYELTEVQTLAEKMGGCITVNQYRRNATTLTLSFLNQ